MRLFGKAKFAVVIAAVISMITISYLVTKSSPHRTSPSTSFFTTRNGKLSKGDYLTTSDNSTLFLVASAEALKAEKDAVHLPADIDKVKRFIQEFSLQFKNDPVGLILKRQTVHDLFPDHSPGDGRVKFTRIKSTADLKSVPNHTVVLTLPLNNAYVKGKAEIDPTKFDSYDQQVRCNLDLLAYLSNRNSSPPTCQPRVTQIVLFQLRLDD